MSIINQRIRNSFSNAAVHYDTLTGLHKEIGQGLIEKVKDYGSCRAVLDIGMGTGDFTRLLTSVFPDAMVVGLDFASGMIARARKKREIFKIVQADASCLPFKEDTFDMIASNLAYQWIEDLPRAFRLCCSRLNKNGGLYLTMFGHNTFYELFAALDMCADKKNDKNNFIINRLADKDQVARALKEAGFNSTRITVEHVKVRFPDMISLIKWVKNIGANTLPRDVYIGRDLLFKADNYYNTHFRDRAGVYATFEVIWVEARQ